MCECCADKILIEIGSRIENVLGIPNHDLSVVLNTVQLSNVLFMNN